MNVLGTQVEAQTVNVLPLFGSIEVPQADPLEDLIQESMDANLEEEVEVNLSPVVQKLVEEDHFPDQSMFVLDQQLSGLKESLRRLKFYLGDLDDLIAK